MGGNNMDQVPLQVHGLSSIRGDRVVWDNIQFQLARGQLLQITGANGCGKTSLLKVLAGLAKAHEGSVIWQGRCIQKQKINYQQQIHYLSHQTSVKNALTVKENLYLNLQKKASDKDISVAVAKVGLSFFQDQFGYQLSQGQKQRVALARLLLSHASLWVLDEPFTALDTDMMEDLQLSFHSQLQSGGMIILTTHRPLTQKHLGYQTLNLE